MATNRRQGRMQQLLAAELEAQRIALAARTAKLARLKQAKAEAEKEAAEYRPQMEHEFQRELTESSGDSGANVQQLEQETEAKIDHLKTGAAKVYEDVSVLLLKHVITAEV